EHLFAATSRGAALIKRIKADPSLRGCEITIVSHDGKPLTPKKNKEADTSASAPAEPAAPPPPPPATAPAPGARSAWHQTRPAIHHRQRDRSADRRQARQLDQSVRRRRAGRLADDPQ